MTENQEYTVKGPYTRRDASAMPAVRYFRVQSRGGYARHGLQEKKRGGFALLVMLDGAQGLRLVGDVALERGQVWKGEFDTPSAAIEAGKAYLRTWGKEAPKAAPKPSKAAVRREAMIAALRAAGASEQAISAAVSALMA